VFHPFRLPVARPSGKKGLDQSRYKPSPISIQKLQHPSRSICGTGPGWSFELCRRRCRSSLLTPRSLLVACVGGHIPWSSGRRNLPTRVGSPPPSLSTTCVGEAQPSPPRVSHRLHAPICAAVKPLHMMVNPRVVWCLAWQR
jgi:hypothetical protein